MKDQTVWNDRVTDLAQKAIDSRLASWQARLRWFATGLTVFAAVGIGWEDLRVFVFEKLYPPEAVYARLKKSLHEDQELRKTVANDFLRLLGPRVDSGYTKTIHLGPGIPKVHGQDFLQFYARPKQKVELTIRSQGGYTDGRELSRNAARFTVTINNRNIFEGDNEKDKPLDYTYANADVSKHLRFLQSAKYDTQKDFEKENDANVFTLRVRPTRLPDGAWAHFELLVLVRNEVID